MPSIHYRYLILHSPTHFSFRLPRGAQSILDYFHKYGIFLMLLTNKNMYLYFIQLYFVHYIFGMPVQLGLGYGFILNFLDDFVTSSIWAPIFKPFNFMC